MSAHVVFENNRPELYIDGVKRIPLVFALSDFPGARSNTAYAQRNIKYFHEQGIDLVAAGAGIVVVNKAKAGKVDLTLKNGKVQNLDLPDNVTAVLDAETGERYL